MKSKTENNGDIKAKVDETTKEDLQKNLNAERRQNRDKGRAPPPPPMPVTLPTSSLIPTTSLSPITTPTPPTEAASIQIVNNNNNNVDIIKQEKVECTRRNSVREQVRQIEKSRPASALNFEIRDNGDINDQKVHQKIRPSKSVDGSFVQEILSDFEQRKKMLENSLKFHNSNVGSGSGSGSSNSNSSSNSVSNGHRKNNNEISQNTTDLKNETKKATLVQVSSFV